MTPPTPPPRGTRPRNRRALIIDAASALFYQRGYSAVSMSDIADAVAIRPSALYRHFPGKQQLLDEAVLDRIGKLADVVGGEPVDLAIPALAAAALGQRESGLLWQREGRQLSDDVRAEARNRLRTVRERLAGLVRSHRPELAPDAVELLAQCTLSVLSTPSFHRQELPQAEHERLLTDVVTSVIRTPLSRREPSGESPGNGAEPRLTTRSRREKILNTAIVMFAEHGYSAVGIEDIAARAETTGPNIYNYFPSKADLLVEGFGRGTEWLRRDLTEALEAARDHTDALHRLIRSYVTVTFANNQLIDLLITELGSLPGDEQTRARKLQHDYIGEWVHILRTVHRECGAVPARIRVQTWFTVVNDIARAPRMRGRPGVHDDLDAVGSSVFGIAPGP